MFDKSFLVQFGHYLAELFGIPDHANWVTGISVIIIVVIAASFINFPLSLIKKTQAKNSQLVHLVEVVRGPLILLAVLYALIFNIELLVPSDFGNWQEWSEPILHLIANAIVLWIALRFLKHKEANFAKIAEEQGGYRIKLINESLDRSTIHKIFLILRMVVFGIFLLMLLQVFGVSVGSILAFGGISGIVVGYAARDFLSNLFSGLRIFIYRPFEVGDWIKCPEQNIEGVVEQVGWQNMRIRTFDKRPLYVPNSLLATSVIENAQQMTGRRLYEYFGVRYEDIGRIRNIVDKIRKMLDEHPDVKQDEAKLAFFDRYGASSLDCFVYCITHKTKWAEYHVVKEDILFKVADIVEQEGAEFAFPTRTLHIEQSSDAPVNKEIPV